MTRMGEEWRNTAKEQTMKMFYETVERRLSIESTYSWARWVVPLVLHKKGPK